MVTATRKGRGKAATQEDTTSKEVSTQEETTPATQETTPQVEEQETPAPKLGGTGVWDALAFWVTILLMRDDPTLAEKGVTTAQVAAYISGMGTPVFLQLVDVGAIPQGAKLADLHAIPEKGEGGWVRKLENSLWRACEATPGNKQAGGGKYTPHLLVRNMDKRPVTFTLAEGISLPQLEEITS